MLDPGWDGRCSTVLLLFISDQSTTEITESTENSLASCFPISAFFVSLRFNPWMWQRLAEVSACGSAAESPGLETPGCEAVAMLWLDVVTGLGTNTPSRLRF